jgi:hypothetical protein
MHQPSRLSTLCSTDTQGIFNSQEKINSNSSKEAKRKKKSEAIPVAGRGGL